MAVSVECCFRNADWQQVVGGQVFVKLFSDGSKRLSVNGDHVLKNIKVSTLTECQRACGTSRMNPRRLSHFSEDRLGVGAEGENVRKSRVPPMCRR